MANQNMNNQGMSQNQKTDQQDLGKTSTSQQRQGSVSNAGIDSQQQSSTNQGLRQNDSTRKQQ